MSTHNSSHDSNRHSTALADRQLRATGGAACVEIVGFPQALYLRRKLDTAEPAGTLIHTVRGAGYRIDTRPAPVGH